MNHRMASAAWARYITSAAILALLLVPLCSPATLHAANWPGWRGEGSGISTEKGLPLEWTTSTNIVWKAPVPGAGNSCPVIWNDRIYLTSTLDADKKRLVLCYDASGREAWRREFAVAAPTPSYPKNGHASHTPVTDGQRVYAFFDEPGLSALNAETGALDWQVELGPFRTNGYFAASPILAGNSVIMVCDVDQSTWQGKKQKGGFILALAPTTGREQWRSSRKAACHAATPLCIRVNGKIQIVVSGDPVIAYDASTGAEIWSCRGMKPVCAPSPVYDGSLVWVTSGRNGPAIAIDPTGQGDITETHATMVTDTGGPYVPSPLVYPFLMLPGDDGQITCLDKSGHCVYRTRLSGHFTASPMGVQDRIYWSDESGKTYVLDARELAAPQPRTPVLAVNDLAEPILASPAASNGRLYLRTSTSLYCIAGQAKTKTPAAGPATQPPPTLSELLARYQKSPAGEGPGVAVRLQVVDALATIHDPGAVDTLLSIAQKDPHWDVSEAAAKALADRGPDAADALLKLLDDHREFPAVIAADALGKLQIVSASPKLVARAGDQNCFVRLAALRALSRIAQAPQADPNSILPTLVTGLSDPEGVVRLAGIQALAGLADKSASHRQEIILALQVCASDKNIRVAKAAAEALAKAYATEPAATSRPANPAP